MKLTEYRIIPCKTFIGDMYLQFKTIEQKTGLFGGVKKVEKWRFVPQELYASVFGVYLSPESCPTSLPLMEESRFLHCFYEQESYDLIPFTNRYKDITQYFEHLANKRKEYLASEKDKIENIKTIYL